MLCNIRLTGKGKSFEESAHQQNTVQLICMKWLKLFMMQTGKRTNSSRPWPYDLGRNRSSGYGLFDRALGATYLHGLAEAVAKKCKK